MTTRLTDAQLERALRDLAPSVQWPPELDVASAVGDRLRAQPRRPRSLRALGERRAVRPIRTRPPAWQLIAAAAVILILAFSAVVVVSPGVRDAVAQWFGLRGIRITQTPSPPPAPTRRLGEGLDLGRAATIQQAERAAGFRVVVPGALGPPDAVFVRPLSIGNEVFLFYRPRAGLPETSQTGVGALISEFRARIDRPLLKKIVFSTQTTFVRVNGQEGYWIKGAHDLAYVDAEGNEIHDTLRLSGSALVWEQDGLTFRLESALSLNRALAVAESIG